MRSPRQACSPNSVEAEARTKREQDFGYLRKQLQSQQAGSSERPVSLRRKAEDALKSQQQNACKLHVHEIISASAENLLSEPQPVNLRPYSTTDGDEDTLVLRLQAAAGKASIIGIIATRFWIEAGPESQHHQHRLPSVFQYGQRASSASSSPFSRCQWLERQASSALLASSQAT